MTSLAPMIALPLIGACLGSFAATAALRLARGEQSLFGRSRCDRCGAPLSFARTTPVLAFMAARGACRDCGGAIDPAHLAGEIGGVAVMLAAMTIAPLGRSVLVLTLGLALLAGAVFDVRTRRLPGALTLVVAVAGAALAWLRSPGALVAGVIAGGAAFLALEALRRGYARVRGRSGLGFGDVKLISALALWLGLATPWAVTLAAAGGLVWSRLAPPLDGRLAFGPFIAAAGFLVGVALEAGPWR